MVKADELKRKLIDNLTPGFERIGHLVAIL